MSDADYDAGRRTVWCRILTECLKELGPDGDAEKWRLEREETVVALRSLCGDFNLSNKWAADLNLADVIEKHVARSLETKLR